MEGSRILLLLLLTTATTTSHSVPLWENLSRQDKIGQIMYVFHRLVDRTCDFTRAPDCRHMVTLHGMSNLLNTKDSALDSLNPTLPGAANTIWKQLMTSPWQLPEEYLPVYLADQDEITNEITTGFHRPFQSLSSLYPNYPPLPNALNTPQRAVSSPHPYAVKVKPPPGFSPNAKEDGTNLEKEVMQTPSDTQKDDNDGGSTSDGDSVAGDGVDGLILGNQHESNSDNFASWTDVGDFANEQQMTDSRLSLDNGGGYANGFESWHNPGHWFTGDRLGDFGGTRMVMESQAVPEWTSGHWNNYEKFENEQELSGNKNEGWGNTGMFMESQAVPDATNGPWDNFGQMINADELSDNRYGDWQDAGMSIDVKRPLEYGSWQEGESDLTNHNTPSFEGSLNDYHNSYDAFGSWTDGGERNERHPDLFGNWMSVSGITDNGDIPHNILGDTDESVQNQEAVNRFSSWTDAGDLLDDRFLDDRLWNWGRNDGPTNDQGSGDRFASWRDAEDIVSSHRDQVIQDRLGNWEQRIDILEAQKPTDQFASWRTVDEIQNTQNTPFNLQHIPITVQAGVDYGGNEEDSFGAQKPNDQFASWRTVEEIQNRKTTSTSHHQNYPGSISILSTQTQHNKNEQNVQDHKPTDQFASWKDVSEIRSGQNTPASHLQNYQDTFLSTQGQYHNSDPYTLWPAVTGMEEEHAVPAAGLVPSADFEPLMVESKVVESRLPPPTAFTSYNDDRGRRRRTFRRGGIYLPLHLLQ